MQSLDFHRPLKQKVDTTIYKRVRCDECKHGQPTDKGPDANWNIYCPPHNQFCMADMTCKMGVKIKK